MALFNEILVGRLNRWVQKFYAIKSGSASLTQLLPTIQTINPVFSGAEDRYLQAFIQQSVFFSVAAVAAQFGQCQIRNPLGSGVIVTVYQVVVSAGSADNPLLQVINNRNVDFATTSALGSSMDNRASGSSVIASQGTAVAQVSGGSASWGVNMGVGNQYNFLQNGSEVPILPGCCLVGQAGTVNQVTNWTMTFRVRPLESSELT